MLVAGFQFVDAILKDSEADKLQTACPPPQYSEQNTSCITCHVKWRSTYTFAFVNGRVMLRILLLWPKNRNLAILTTLKVVTKKTTNMLSSNWVQKQSVKINLLLISENG